MFNSYSTLSKRSLLVCALMALSSLAARDVHAQATDNERRVGIWVLDQNAATKSMSKNVQATLEQYKYQVITTNELRRNLTSARTAAPDASALKQFQGISGRVAKGIKAYFYGDEQHKAAIAQLEPIFEEGIKRVDVLGFRPDVASQIYEAGSVLLRAYHNKKDRINRTRIAKQLAIYFPHMLPSKATIPQEVIDLVDAQRQKMAVQQTSMFLEMKAVGTRTCQLYINGMPAAEKTKVMVDPDLTYYVQMKCNEVNAPMVWPVRIKRGKSTTVPIVDRDPFSFVMKDDSFTNRAIATSYMSFVLFWSPISQFVGLSRSRQKNNGDFLIVRMAPGKGAIWSDGTTNRTVLKLLASVFPEIEVKEEPVKPPPVVQSSAPVWPWVVLTTGLISTVAGGGLTYYWHGEVSRYRCTPDGSGKTEDGCDGVDGYTPPSTETGVKQFNDDWNTAITNRWIGVGVLSLGAVLSTVGIVGLATGSDSTETSSVHVMPAHDGASVRWRFTF